MMANLLRRICAIAAMAVLSVGVSGQGNGQLPQERLALANANLVDVRTGAVRSGVTIVLAGGRIESVGTAAPAAGTRVIDLAARHVLPGLIDAHVHIGSLPQMRAALESGVTTARSAGVSGYVDVGLKRLVENGFVAGPELLASGYHVRTHPAPELFFNHPDLGDLLGGVTSIEGIRRVVAANLSSGVDWIKVNATERAGTPDTDPRKQMFSEAELRAIVEEAAKRTVPVQAHAHGAEGALAAVRAGVRSIEHGTWLSDEALKLMASQGTFFDPTADVVGDLAEPGGDYDNAALQRRGQMMQPILRAAIGRAHALGVKIVAGSDTGYGPTSIARVSREILVLREAGLSPLQALQAATLVNAEMMRIEKRVGSLEPGFEADVLVVEGNPIEDLRTLLDPLLVVSNGRVALDRLSFGR